MNIRNSKLAFVYFQAQDVLPNLIERVLSYLPKLFDLSRDHFLALFYERSSVIWLAINNKSLGISVPVRITSPDINRFSSVEIKSSFSIIFISIAKKISSSMIWSFSPDCSSFLQKFHNSKVDSWIDFFKFSLSSIDSESYWSKECDDLIQVKLPQSYTALSTPCLTPPFINCTKSTFLPRAAFLRESLIMEE